MESKSSDDGHSWRKILGVDAAASDDDIHEAYKARCAEIDAAKKALATTQKACDGAYKHLKDEKRKRNDKRIENDEKRKKIKNDGPAAILKAAIEADAWSCEHTSQAFDLPVDADEAKQVIEKRVTALCWATLAMYAPAERWRILFRGDGRAQLARLRSEVDSIHISHKDGGHFAGIPNARFCFIQGDRKHVIDVAKQFHAILTSSPPPQGGDAQ